ncbi:MAG TPA: metallophosphoesterase [Bacteroidia bacterium]|nr:metallophosphoesterase [Bacteroidia bacterium]
MPLHLDPLSRRRFLGGSAILTLSSLLPGTSRGAESLHWALLSDTHIAADPATVSKQGVTMAKQLQQVVAEVLAEKDSLAGVIVNGDCAYLTGLADDYRTFASLMEPLREAGLPLHFNLGNHDDRETLASVLGETAGASVVEGKRCTVLETPLANWLLLDSMRVLNQVEGEIGAAQLAWIDRYLSENSGKPAIVVAHHYPQPEPEAGKENARITGLVDTGDFLALIDRQPAAKAYLYGHSHVWTQKRRESGVQEVNLPTTAYVFRPEQPAGWVKASVTPTGMSLELRTLDHAHPQHGETHQLAWR